jgi:hypothetical protein
MASKPNKKITTASLLISAKPSCPMSLPHFSLPTLYSLELQYGHHTVMTTCFYILPFSRLIERSGQIFNMKDDPLGLSHTPSMLLKCTAALVFWTLVFYIYK